LFGGPVADGSIGRMWARTGSPQTARGLPARLAEGRPGPWGFAAWYAALLAAFLLVLAGVWRAVDKAGRGA
jgi:hypothetical protein